MKTLKAIIAIIVLTISTNVSAQTLEGKWMGYDSGGNVLRVEFRNDFTCFFMVNNQVLHTIDYEPYYNFTPNRVVISYTAPSTIAGLKKTRYKAGIFEYITANKLKFQYMESDGNVFPTSFQGCYVLHPVTDFNVHFNDSPSDL